MPTNHEIVTAHYAAGAAGDFEAALAPVRPDTRWIEAAGFPTAGTYVGRDEIVAGVFGALGALFDDFAFVLERVVDGGDTQVGIGEYRGTARATGKPFRARVAHVWRFVDGVFVELEQFVDSATVRVSMA